jgi:hypothetical protein
MSCQNHAILRPVQARPSIGGAREGGDGAVGVAGGYGQQGIDHGVAREMDIARDPGGGQVGHGAISGGKVELGNLGNQPPVGFLGVGAEQVIGAESGFNVADGNLVVEGGEGGGEGGGGVALDDHEIGRSLDKIVGQSLQAPASNIGEGLARLHDRQIAIAPQVKKIHHAIHHFPVLSRQHHFGLEAAIALKRQNHRSQLDRFRTGTQN